ncbi:replication-relaxation family protein [Streptomyces sp. NPDC051561]|uniref:replication-relaxation family protein n=1 Tax=Streptomyces sp. NPDC051561 TaxID=3365658 RepID=UPI0037BBCD27
MARKTNSAGSSNGLRKDVLSVLGVLKVATTDQIQRIASPHLSYRHTDKKTPSERKTARTASHGGAFADLRDEGLAQNGGTTSGGESLRHLTEKGMKAAAYALDRPAWEMGGTGSGAGSSGADHLMSVNETMISLLRPKPDLLQLADDEPEEALQAARDAVAAPAGVGTLADYMTEVALPATGTWTSPGKGGAQADLVLTAPEDDIPLLFVEVDNCHMSAQKLAGKIAQYRAFFERPATRTQSAQMPVNPMWRARWQAPAAHDWENPHPPVLFVFNRLGERNPDTVIPAVEKLALEHWAGIRYQDHTRYSGKIPVVVTGFHMLREHGPRGQIFRRFGRDGYQSLHDAIGNPRRDTAVIRQREAARAEDQRKKELLAQEERERQEWKEDRARQKDAAWPCPTCGRLTWPEHRGSDGQWESSPDRGDDCRPCAGYKERDRKLAEERAAMEAEAKREAKKNGLFGFLR